MYNQKMCTNTNIRLKSNGVRHNWCCNLFIIYRESITGVRRMQFVLIVSCCCSWTWEVFSLKLVRTYLEGKQVMNQVLFIYRTFFGFVLHVNFHH